LADLANKKSDHLGGRFFYGLSHSQLLLIFAYQK